MRLKTVTFAAPPAAGEGDEAHLVLPSSAPKIARLRVVDRERRGDYYQLDATVESPAFHWPTKDVLEPTHRTIDSLAALAWTSDQIYVPSALALQPEPVTERSVAVIIESDSPIDRVVRAVLARGQSRTPLQPANQLPASEVRLEFGGSQPGVHRLWITLVTKGGNEPESHSWNVWLP